MDRGERHAMVRKTKYEVKCGGEWVTAERAKEVRQGFLHYELKDGTNGLAQPGSWRVKK